MLCCFDSQEYVFDKQQVIYIARKKNYKKNSGNTGLWIVGIIAIILAVGFVMTLGGSTDNVGVVDPETGVPLPNSIELGTSSTLNFNAFTGVWGDQGAKTEIYPTWTIVNQDDDTLVNDAKANSTTLVVVGDTADAYVTGATYYGTPVLGKKISGTQEILDMEVYTAVATTDLVITAYDTDQDALTADDHANNTADYAGGDVSASDNEVYYFKLSNSGANVNYQLDTICTWILGDEADDFEMSVSGWTEVNVADTLDSASITMYDDTNASTSEKGFKHCYTIGTPIMLKENMDTGKLKFVFDSDDTTQPTANGDTYFGAVFLDGSYSVDKSGDVKYGYIMDDDTEDPASVGVDESADTTHNGLDIAVAIEPQ